MNTQTSFNFDQEALGDEVIRALQEQRQPAARMRTGRKHETARAVAQGNSGLSLAEKKFQQLLGYKFDQAVDLVAKGLATPRLEMEVRKLAATKKTQTENMKKDEFFLGHVLFTLGMNE